MAAEKPPKAKIAKNEKLHKRFDHTPFRPSPEDKKLRELYQGPLAFQRELSKELKGHDGKVANQTELLRSIYSRLRAEEGRLKGGAYADGHAEAGEAYRAGLESTIESNEAEHKRLQEALESDSQIDLEKDAPEYDAKLIAKKRKQADELEAFKLRAAETKAEFVRIKSFTPAELGRHSQRRLAEVQNALDYLDIFDGLRDSQTERDLPLKSRNFAAKKYTTEKDKFWGKGTKEVRLLYESEDQFLDKQMVVEAPMDPEMQRYGIRKRTEARAAGAPNPVEREARPPRPESSSSVLEAAEAMTLMLEKLSGDEGRPDKKGFQQALEGLVRGVARQHNLDMHNGKDKRDAIEAAKVHFVTSLTLAMFPNVDTPTRDRMAGILSMELDHHKNPGIGKFKEFVRDLPEIAMHMRHANSTSENRPAFARAALILGRKAMNMGRPRQWTSLRDTPELLPKLMAMHRRAKQLAKSV